MNEATTVYCLECNLLVLRNEAQIIFRTGFYRTNIPLCHCKYCSCIEDRITEVGIIADAGKTKFHSNDLGEIAYL